MARMLFQKKGAAPPAAPSAGPKGPPSAGPSASKGALVGPGGAPSPHLLIAIGAHPGGSAAAKPSLGDADAGGLGGPPPAAMQASHDVTCPICGAVFDPATGDVKDPGQDAGQYGAGADQGGQDGAPDTSTADNSDEANQ